MEFEVCVQPYFICLFSPESIHRERVPEFYSSPNRSQLKCQRSLLGTDNVLLRSSLLQPASRRIRNWFPFILLRPCIFGSSFRYRSADTQSIRGPCRRHRPINVWACGPKWERMKREPFYKDYLFETARVIREELEAQPG
jgi:hypothetical protein